MALLAAIAATKAQTLATSKAGRVGTIVPTQSMHYVPRDEAQSVAILDSMALEPNLRLSVLERIAAHFKRSNAVSAATVAPAISGNVGDRCLALWFAAPKWYGGNSSAIPIGSTPMLEAELCSHQEVGWIPSATCFRCNAEKHRHAGGTEVCAACGRRQCKVHGEAKIPVTICQLCDACAATCDCAKAALVLASLCVSTHERAMAEAETIATRIRRSKVRPLEGWTPWPSRGRSACVPPSGAGAPRVLTKSAVSARAAQLMPPPPRADNPQSATPATSVAGVASAPEAAPASTGATASHGVNSSKPARLRRAEDMKSLATSGVVTRARALENVVQRLRIELRTTDLAGAKASALARPGKLVAGRQDLPELVDEAARIVAPVPAQTAQRSSPIAAAMATSAPSASVDSIREAIGALTRVGVSLVDAAKIVGGTIPATPQAKSATIVAQAASTAAAVAKTEKNARARSRAKARAEARAVSVAVANSPSGPTPAPPTPQAEPPAAAIAATATKPPPKPKPKAAFAGASGRTQARRHPTNVVDRTPPAERALPPAMTAKPDQVELYAVELQATLGHKSSHCAAFTMLVGSEIPCAQVHGVATAEGLRVPAAWTVVDGDRPAATTSVIATERTCTITIAPGGYRVYDGTIAPVGTALVRRRSNRRFDDVDGWMSDPEIVLAIADHGKDFGLPQGVYGNTSPTSDIFTMYAALCPTLVPWETDDPARRAETIVSACCTAMLATAFMLDNDSESALAVLRFADGSVESLARKRMKWREPSDDLARFRITQSPFAAAAGTRAATFVAAQMFVNRTRWASSGAVSIVDRRFGVGCELEELLCRDAKAFVQLRLDLVVVPHAGGSYRAVDKLRARAGALAKDGLVPRCDGTVRGGGVVYLPCAGTTDDDTATAFALLVAMIAHSGARAAQGPCGKAPTSVELAARDFWLADCPLEPTTIATVPLGHRNSDAGVPAAADQRSSVSAAPRATEIPRIRPVEQSQTLVDALLDHMASTDPDVAVARLYAARESKAVAARRGLAATERVPPAIEAAKRAAPTQVWPLTPLSAAPNGKVRVSLPYEPLPEAFGPANGTTRAVASFCGLRLFRLIESHGTIVPRASFVARRAQAGVVRRFVLATFVASPRAFGLLPRVASSSSELHWTAGYGETVPVAAVNGFNVVDEKSVFDLAFRHANDPIGAPLAVTANGDLAVGGVGGQWAYQGHPLVRADAAMIVGFVKLSPRLSGRDKSIIASLAHAPTLVGGDNVRKEVAVALHMRLLCGPHARDDTPDQWLPTDLLNVQRYLSRGLFFSSKGCFEAPKRRTDVDSRVAGRDVAREARAWILAAARAAIAANRGHCCLHGCKRPTTGSIAPAYCPAHALTELRVLQGGGGTIAATRRAGGMHATVVAYARSVGLDPSDPRHAPAIIRRALADDSLPAVAVWTPVYPANQTGARMQETPSTKTGLAGIVVRATITQAIDRFTMVEQLVPRNGRLEFGLSKLTSPLIAFDATACSDSQDQVLIRQVAQLCEPAINGGVVAMALDAVLSYDSVEMSASEWAARTNVSAELDVNVARPPKRSTKIVLNGVETEFKVLAVIGATGSGKTSALAALDDQTPIALCLPTRLSIQLSAQRLAQTTGRPSEAVFLNAGSLENGFVLTDVGATTDDSLGAARCNPDGKWTALSRRALSADRAYGTPYQLREARALQARLAIVDEVHERTFERARAVAALLLSDRPFIVASATIPSDMRAILDPDRTVTIQASDAAPKSFSVSTAMTARGTRTLFVCSSVRECLQRCEKHGQGKAVVLHGMLPPAEQALLAAGVEDVYATVGLVASAITIPGVDSVVVTPGVRQRRRFKIGTGVEVTTAWTLDEALQIVGRAGRDVDVATVFFEKEPKATAVSGAAHWRQALLAAGLEFARDDEVRGTCGENLYSQVSTIGNPTLADDECVLALQLLGGCPSALALLRAAYGSLTTYLGFKPGDESRFLADDELKDFEQGLDPGTFLNGVRYAGHAALTTETLPVTEWYARALIVRQGAGFYGAYGMLLGGHKPDKREAAMVGAYGVPTCDAPVPNSVVVNGRRYVAQGVRFGPEAASVGDVESAIVGQRKRRRNVVGSPMGCNSNGPIVNALISLAATAADALVLSVEDAIASGESWTGPKIGWSPASISSTGGDDQLTQGGPLAEAAGYILRDGSGAPSSLRKTGVTPYSIVQDDGSDGLIARSGAERERLLGAFGGRIGPTGGLAPFLEHYYDPAGFVTTPSPWTAAVRLIATIVAGEGVVDQSSLRYTGTSADVKEMLGCTAAAACAISLLQRDERPATGICSTVSTEVSDGEGERVLHLPSWLETLVSGPAKAGKIADGQLGSKALAAICEERARHTSHRCPVCGKLAKGCPTCAWPACCRHRCVPPLARPLLFAGSSKAKGVVPYVYALLRCRRCNTPLQQPTSGPMIDKCASCVGKHADRKEAVRMIEVFANDPNAPSLYGPTFGQFVDLDPGLYDAEKLAKFHDFFDAASTVHRWTLGTSQISDVEAFLSPFVRQKLKFKGDVSPLSLKQSKLRYGYIGESEVPTGLCEALDVVCRAADGTDCPTETQLVIEWLKAGAPRRSAGADPLGWSTSEDDARRLAEIMIGAQPHEHPGERGSLQWLVERHAQIGDAPAGQRSLPAVASKRAHGESSTDDGIDEAPLGREVDPSKVDDYVEEFAEGIVADGQSIAATNVASETGSGSDALCFGLFD